MQDLVGVQVPLTYLNFGDRATGNVTPRKLKLGCQRFLSQACPLTEEADIGADLFLDFLIHILTIIKFLLTLLYSCDIIILHLYRSNPKICHVRKGRIVKLLIVGSRSIGAFDLSPYVAEDVDMIISGGANGIDRLAEEYADTRRLSKLILRPAYARYGKAAPLKRNEEMVDMADRILVIWDGRSKGTAYTVKYAQKTGKPVQLIQM